MPIRKKNAKINVPQKDLVLYGSLVDFGGFPGLHAGLQEGVGWEEGEEEGRRRGGGGEEENVYMRQWKIVFTRIIIIVVPVRVTIPRYIRFIQII